MRTFSRFLIALLAAAFIGVAAFSAPALARPSSAAATPSPSPSGPSSGTPTAPSPHASNRLTFGIGPAGPVPSDHYVDGRPYISALSAAGGVIRDDVALLNVSRSPVTLTVYPADAVQNGSNTFQLSLKNQKLKAAGSWFTLKGRTSLTVTVPGSHAAAGNRNVPGRILIPIEARIPFNAIPGDHAAAIMAELDAHAKNQNGANITLQQRLGVAVYIHLAGRLYSGLQVSNLKAHWNEPGNALGTSHFSVTFTVTNTGNVRLNASTLVNTTRWFVGSITRYPGELTNIFPGSRINVTENVNGVFGFGPWKTTASAFPMPVDASLTLSNQPSSQTVSQWTVPWILIAIIVGLILIAIVAWRVYRRWRKHRKENPRVKGTRSAKQKPDKKDKKKSAAPKGEDA